MTTPRHNVTTPPAGVRQTPGTGTSVEVGGDAYIRRSGKTLILAVYAALRAIRLYPLENAAVQNSVAELTQLADDIIGHEHEDEMRVSGVLVFIDTVRLQLDIDHYVSFSLLLFFV